MIVDQHRVAGIGQGEFAQRPAVGRADASDAFAHIAAFDQHHQHPVDAVAVHALGRRASLFVGAGLDPELVQFDMPGAGAGRGEMVGAEGEDRLHHRIGDGGGVDGIEPALHVAVERIIVAALPVGLVRLAREDAVPTGEGGVAAATIAAAIGHVEIRPQMPPTGGEGGPVGLGDVEPVEHRRA